MQDSMAENSSTDLIFLLELEIKKIIRKFYKKTNWYPENTLAIIAITQSMYINRAVFEKG
jgi:hypothetical protein